MKTAAELSEVRGELGTWAVVREVCGSGPLVLLGTGRKLYWEAKDLPAAIALLQAAMTTALSEAARDGDADGSKRSVAKTAAYDLASFAWPGWGEAGIDPGAPELAAGREAAALNLALAEELGKPTIAVSRAVWMLGAYALSDGHFEEAAERFGVAEALAGRAGETAESAMCRAYAALAEALETGEAVESLALEGALRHLRTLKDGETLAMQVETARRALSERAG